MTFQTGGGEYVIYGEEKYVHVIRGDQEFRGLETSRGASGERGESPQGGNRKQPDETP